HSQSRPTATTHLSTLSLHDALPIFTLNKDLRVMEEALLFPTNTQFSVFVAVEGGQFFTLESVKLKIDDKMVSTHLYSAKQREALDRKSTRLNSSHVTISYAVFCLKK